MDREQRHGFGGYFHRHRVAELVLVTVTITDAAGDVRAVRSAETWVICECGNR